MPAQRQHHLLEVIVTSEQYPVRFFRSVDNGSYVPYHYHAAWELIFIKNGAMTLSAPVQSGALAYCLAKLPQIPEHLPRDLDSLQAMPLPAIDTHKVMSAPEYAAQRATATAIATAAAAATTAVAAADAEAAATTAHAEQSAQAATNHEAPAKANHASATATSAPHTETLTKETASLLASAASKDTAAPNQRGMGSEAAAAQGATGTLAAPAPQTPLPENSCHAANDTHGSKSPHDAMCGGQEHSAQTPFSSSRLAADLPSRNHSLSAADTEFTDPTFAHNSMLLGAGLSGGEYTCALQANGYNFALINSNEMHASSCQHYNEAYVLQIPETFLAESINYPQSFPLYLDLHQASEQDLKHLTRAFWRLIVVHECLQDQDGFKVYFNHALYSLLESLLPLVVSGHALQQLKLEPSRSANLKRLQPVFDFLRDHYHEPLKLEQLAALAHLHPGYFCSVFKDAVGMSPMSYLSEIRMCHVYYDLAESKLPISTILQRHGYTNTKKFYRLFKERFHVSPREVQASHHKQALHSTKEASYFDRLFAREEPAPATPEGT